MSLDRDHLAEILHADYGYYYDTATAPVTEIVDRRLKPETSAFLGTHLQPGMRVLEIGCGNGATLLDHSAVFGYGVGIDNAPVHLELANRARERAGVTNVEFRLATFDPDDIGELANDPPYDVIFTERGPFGKDERGIRAVLEILRPDGLIFAEVVGERHHREMRELFGPRETLLTSSREQATVAMERARMSVRVSADFVTKRHYASVYDWLRYQCHIWAWAGHPFPDADDPRLELFAERNQDAEGGIVITDHVAWVGAVRSEQPP